MGMIQAGHDCKMDTSAWKPRYASLLKQKIAPGTPTKSSSHGNITNYRFTNKIFVVFKLKKRLLLKMFH
jgi:hypothetical protein